MTVATSQRVFSMRMARVLTGVADRAARDLVQRGLLPRTDLTEQDVLAAQVLAAAVPLPAAAGMAELRDEAVGQAARRAWFEADRSWSLVVTPTDAKLVARPDLLVAMLAAYADLPRLVLPIGVWMAALREATQT